MKEKVENTEKIIENLKLAINELKEELETNEINTDEHLFTAGKIQGMRESILMVKNSLKIKL